MKARIVHGKITNLYQRTDTDGNVIHASDGGVIFADGQYHWYGLRLRPRPFAPKGEGGQVTDTGVVMYASSDLVSWKYEGVILACSQEENNPLRAPMRFERPKIIYNQATKKYVLWCHYVKYPGDHGFGPGTAEAGVAVCDRVNGQYRFLGTCRPIDESGFVRDCTLFQDDDGNAFFVYDRQVSREFKPVLEPFERCLHIVKLSDDYLSCTKEYARIDAADGREAPCLVKNGGWYYMVTSGLTGWAYNQARYCRAKSIMGPWEDMGDPCVGDDEKTTFRTQGTYIFDTRAGESVMMLERHNTENFERCTYVWLPIRYGNNGTLKLVFEEEITLEY